MAAEWSRELSVKVHAGHCRIASLGYRVGAPVGYGLRRLMVDESQHPKGWPERGQYKALQSDRVRLQHGSAEQAAVIRCIFDQFVNGRNSYSEIKRQLNDAGIANHNGRPWTDGMIPTILGNENYVGKTIYNRTSRRLGQKLVKNSNDAWVRGAAGIGPIVDPDLFARAQKLLAERPVEIPEDEMLLRLRLTLRRRGKLNSRIINATLGLNHISSHVKHFGSLRLRADRIPWSRQQVPSARTGHPSRMTIAWSSRPFALPRARMGSRLERGGWLHPFVESEDFNGNRRRAAAPIFRDDESKEPSVVDGAPACLFVAAKL